MKRTMGLAGLVFLAGTLISFNCHAQNETPRPSITYDKKADELSVTAKDASYKEVMATIASLTGVEILMDPKAEHQLTISLSKSPLEKALKDLGRDSNVAFVYSDVKPDSADKNAPVKTIITSMQILPKGAGGPSNLQPLLTPGGEAFIREKNRATPPNQQLKVFDYAQQRWDARLKKMAPEKRELLLAEAQEKLDRANKEQAERKQKQEERKKAREERDQQREQKRQERLESLKTTNPELYDIKQQRHEEAEQKRKKLSQQPQT